MISKSSTVCAAVAVLTLSPAVALAHTPLALFGTPVRGASRAVLQKTLSKAGLSPIRVNDYYFCDTYHTDGIPHGASKLMVCYTGRTNTFAMAEYTFPAFMDTQLVKRVIGMVQYKYGRPSSVSGSYGLGPVTARWYLPGGMRITVKRGWPDATTYLDLIDTVTNRRLVRQIQAVRNAQQKQQHKGDSNGF